MHAPLHWLNNRLSRVCAGAPYLSTDTSSHRSTSGNVFLRSQCKWKIDVAFACTRNFPLNAMRFSQIRIAEEPEREGGGWQMLWVCVSWLIFHFSCPLLQLFSFDFKWIFIFLFFMFASLWWLRTKRNETSFPYGRQSESYAIIYYIS